MVTGLVTAGTSPSLAANSAPLALTGTVAGAVLDDAEFIVTAWPRDDIEKQLQDGDRVPTHRLPSGTVQSQGTDFELRVDPGSLPADVINDDGRVHFDVMVIEPILGLRGMSGATVALVRGANADDVMWIDPLHPLAEGDLETPAALADLDPAPEPVTVAVKLSPSSVPAMNAMMADNQAQSEGCAAGEWVLETSSNREAIIATTYVSGTASSGFAGHASTRTFTHGKAFKAYYEGASWEKSGTRTFESGYKFDWDPSNANTRSYRPIIRYGRYAYETWYIGSCERFEREWRPRYAIGTDTDVTSTDGPTWSGLCDTDHVQSSGEWRRTATTGEDFSSSVGVKIKDVIGFDLSSRRAYSTTAYIAYKIAGGPKMLCGSGGKYPAVANRVRLRVFKG